MSGHNNATFCCYIYVAPHNYTNIQIRLYKFAQIHNKIHKYTIIRRRREGYIRT